MPRRGLLQQKAIGAALFSRASGFLDADDELNVRPAALDEGRRRS
jgi:hypothetical protein